MTKVGYGNLTVNEGRQWEESGRFPENCVHIVVWPTNQWWQVRQSLSPYRVGLIKRISGQTGMTYTVSSRLPSPCDVTQGRCHVALRGATRSAIQQLLSAA